MAEDKRQNQALPEEANQNPGARTAAVHANPEILDEEARNAFAGEGPNAAGGAGKPGPVEDHVPSNSSTEATDLPTANAPRTETAHHPQSRDVSK